MNATAEKFGYPETLIREYEHWLVLLREQQISLGSLVLVCKDPALRFSDVTSEAFVELHRVIVDIEQTLETQYRYDKINYLMLMMVDPDVHYHVIPRYETAREFSGHRSSITAGRGPPRWEIFSSFRSRRSGS